MTTLERLTGAVAENHALRQEAILLAARLTALEKRLAAATHPNILLTCEAEKAADSTLGAGADGADHSEDIHLAYQALASLPDFLVLRCGGFLDVSASVAQQILQDCTTEGTTDEGRTMICALPDSAATIVNAVTSACALNKMYIEDCWGQCLGPGGGQHDHFDQMSEHVVGRLVVRLGAVGKLVLVVGRDDVSSTRAAGPLKDRERSAPIPLPRGDLGTVTLGHSDSYFIGRVSSGADELGATGSGIRVSHEVPATDGNSVSIVFQIATIAESATPDGTAAFMSTLAASIGQSNGTAAAAAAAAAASGQPTPSPAAVPLSFDCLSPVRDETWQHWQRREHGRLRGVARQHARAVFDPTSRDAAHLLEDLQVDTLSPLNAKIGANAMLLRQALSRAAPTPTCSVRPLLILDMNGVLVDRGDYIARIESKTPTRLVKRPFCDEFLAAVSKNFDLAVWTAGLDTDITKDELSIFPDPLALPPFLQDFCTKIEARHSATDPEKPLFVKDLHKLWNLHPEYSHDNTFILDHDADKVDANPLENCIVLLSKWLSADASDTVLHPDGELCTLLKGFASRTNGQSLATFVGKSGSHLFLKNRPVLAVPQSIRERAFFKRSDHNMRSKNMLQESIDRVSESREDWIMKTVLCGNETVMRPIIFPFDDLLPDFYHWQLWSTTQMDAEQLSEWVNNELVSGSNELYKTVRAWGCRIETPLSVPGIFHAHIFLHAPGTAADIGSVRVHGCANPEHGLYSIHPRPALKPSDIAVGSSDHGNVDNVIHDGEGDANVVDSSKSAEEVPSMLLFAEPFFGTGLQDGMDDESGLSEHAAEDPDHSTQLFVSKAVMGMFKTSKPLTVVELVGGSSASTVWHVIADSVDVVVKVANRQKTISEYKRAKMMETLNGVQHVPAVFKEPIFTEEGDVGALITSFVSDATTFEDMWMTHAPQTSDISGSVSESIRDLFGPGGILDRRQTVRRSEVDVRNQISSEILNVADEASPFYSLCVTLAAQNWPPKAVGSDNGLTAYNHNDVHAKNVLVQRSTSSTYLIDFAAATYSPMLKDAATFMFSILFQLAPCESGGHLEQACKLHLELFPKVFADGVCNLHCLPTANLSDLDPAFERAGRAVLVIWSFLGPQVIACGGNDSDQHPVNLYLLLLQQAVSYCSTAEEGSNKQLAMEHLAEHLLQVLLSWRDTAWEQQSSDGNDTGRKLKNVQQASILSAPQRKATTQHPAVHKSLLEWEAFHQSGKPIVCGSEVLKVRSLYRSSSLPPGDYGWWDGCKSPTIVPFKEGRFRFDYVELGEAYIGGRVRATVRTHPKVSAAVPTAEEKIVVNGHVRYIGPASSSANMLGVQLEAHVVGPDTDRTLFTNIADPTFAALSPGMAALFDEKARAVKPIIEPAVVCYPIGTRITLREPGLNYGLVCTIVDVSEKDGSYILRIDNSGDPGRQLERQLMKWDHTLAPVFDSYTSGVVVSIVGNNNTWSDYQVVERRGPSSYFVLPVNSGGGGGGGDGSLAINLNEANHIVPRLDAETFAKEAKQYLDETASSSSVVVDGITGNALKTREQLVTVEIEDITSASLQESDGVRKGVFDDDDGEEEVEEAKYDDYGNTIESDELVATLDTIRSDMFQVGNAIELSGQLIRPCSTREHGFHSTAPVLIKAGAGSGKSWLTLQILSVLCTENLSSGYMPLMIPIQRLAHILRKQRGKSSVNKETSLMEWFINSEFADNAKRRDMLLDAFQSRRLVLLIDGVDEAADLRDEVQAVIRETLLRNQHRFVVTSRPEGVRYALYRDSFVVLNLKEYSEEQQRKVLDQQLAGDSKLFVVALLNYSRALATLDGITGTMDPTDLKAVVELPAIDLTRNSKGFVIDWCQIDFDGNPVEYIDDLFEVAALVQDVFNEEAARICSVLELPVSGTTEQLAINDYYGLLKAPLKGRRRSEKKTLDVYQPEVDAGLRPGTGLSWLIDVVRAAIMCKTAAEMLAIVKEVKRSKLFTVVRLKNYFVDLDPIHFRRIGLTLAVKATATRPQHMCELQIHVSEMFKFKSEHKEMMHKPYEYFRTLFGPQIDGKLIGARASVDDDDGWMSFDKRVKVWNSFLGTPVIMALFVVVLGDFDFVEAPDVAEFPDTQASLYKKAVEIIVRRVAPHGESYANLLEALKVASCANHAAGRREFTFADLTHVLGQGSRLTEVDVGKKVHVLRGDGSGSDGPADDVQGMLCGVGRFGSVRAREFVWVDMSGQPEVPWSAGEVDQSQVFQFERSSEDGAVESGAGRIIAPNMPKCANELNANMNYGKYSWVVVSAEKEPRKLNRPFNDKELGRYGLMLVQVKDTHYDFDACNDSDDSDDEDSKDAKDAKLGGINGGICYRGNNYGKFNANYNAGIDTGSTLSMKHTGGSHNYWKFPADEVPGGAPPQPTNPKPTRSLFEVRSGTWSGTGSSSESTVAPPRSGDCVRFAELNYTATFSLTLECKPNDDGVSPPQPVLVSSGVQAGSQITTIPHGDKLIFVAPSGHVLTIGDASVMNVGDDFKYIYQYEKQNHYDSNETTWAKKSTPFAEIAFDHWKVEPGPQGSSQPSILCLPVTQVARVDQSKEGSQLIEAIFLCINSDLDSPLRVPTLKILETLAEGPATDITLQSTHLSLQEYLCAEHILEQLSSGDSGIVNVGFDCESKQGVCSSLNMVRKTNMWKIGAELGLGGPLLCQFVSTPSNLKLPLQQQYLTNTLDLSNSGLTDHGYGILSMLLSGAPLGSSLTSLVLSDCAIQLTVGEVVQPMEWATHLQQLDLRDNDLYGPVLKSDIQKLARKAPKLCLVLLQGNLKLVRDSVGRFDLDHQAGVVSTRPQFRKMHVTTQTLNTCMGYKKNYPEIEEDWQEFIGVVTPAWTIHATVEQLRSPLEVRIADNKTHVVEHVAWRETGSCSDAYAYGAFVWAWEAVGSASVKKMNRGKADALLQFKERDTTFVRRWESQRNAVQSQFGNVTVSIRCSGCGKLNDRRTCDCPNSD